MLIRVIALALSVVLFWSVVSTMEAPPAFAQPSPEKALAVALDGSPAPALAGSVEHHHLDDQPAQGHNDHPAETPGLLLWQRAPARASAMQVRLRGIAAAPASAPCLAGPLRPPCSPALAG